MGYDRPSHTGEEDTFGTLAKWDAGYGWGRSFTDAGSVVRAMIIAST
jgi:hypothetical protein